MSLYQKIKNYALTGIGFAAATVPHLACRNNDFMYGNFPDIAIVFQGYFFGRAIDIADEPNAIWAGMVSTGGILMELGQGVGIVPGTFDPTDILCYVVGGISAYALDRVMSPKKSNLDTLVES